MHFPSNELLDKEKEIMLNYLIANPQGSFLAIMVKIFIGFQHFYLSAALIVS